MLNTAKRVLKNLLMSKKEKAELIAYFVDKFSANANAQCNDDEAAKLRSLFPKNHDDLNDGTKALFLAELVKMQAKTAPAAPVAPVVTETETATKENS